MRLNDISEGLKDPKDNPCWKGYHPVGTKKKDGRTVPNCVPESVEEGLTDEINPADVGEYDREGDMAKQDLATAADAANELRSILDSDENLPEWVQAKITKAVDYLDTVRDYMKSKEHNVEEGYGRYWCSTDKKWKQRQGPKQTRKASEAYNPLDQERREQAAMDYSKKMAKRDEFYHGEPPNNIEVVINGRAWKVFAGKGSPDSMEERNHFRKMQQWAASKSAATGKKWEVRLTGAPVTP